MLLNLPRRRRLLLLLRLPIKHRHLQRHEIYERSPSSSRPEANYNAADESTSASGSRFDSQAILRTPSSSGAAVAPAADQVAMTASEWVMVAAILCGPVLAVQAQKWLEILRENKNRRLYIYKRLMTTRSATLSPNHVEALNAIDLEFNGKGRKDQRVRRRWKEYLDHLGSLNQDPEEQKQQLDRWTDRGRDLLADLLYDMGLAVGYDFDKVHIRRGIYSPIGHANYEFETQAIRRLLLELLAGNRTLPMDVRSLPAMQPPAQQQDPSAKLPATS